MSFFNSLNTSMKLTQYYGEFLFKTNKPDTVLLMDFHNIQRIVRYTLYTIWLQKMNLGNGSSAFSQLTCKQTKAYSHDVTLLMVQQTLL